MAFTRTKPLFVDKGYGQVEPNHLSAQRTGQIYAQLPAEADMDVLENGQFVKYDYAHGVVTYGEKVGDTTPTVGEWMLVFNEIKVYRDHLQDCDFAMKKDDYMARVYSPIGDVTGYANSRIYNDATVIDPLDGQSKINPGKITNGPDQYEPDSTTNPFVIEQRDRFTAMPANTTMVPRVFKTNVGDIYTTNCVNVAAASLTVGTSLYVGDKGYLTTTKKTTADGNGAVSGDMVWQIVKVYTLPDRQKAVKIMRIA